MGNLFLSFTIAIGSAIGVIALSRALDFEGYINKILPLIPVLYALIYEVLDRKSGKSRKGASAPRDEAKPSSGGVEAGITASKVVVDVAVSYVVKFSVELFLVSLFLRFSGQSFSDVYGSFRVETIANFLRGDHPWLTSHEGIYLLALVAIVTTFVTGSWIGHTSKGNAILEGVLTGAAVTLINSMTNMLVLYRTIEETTMRLADSMGYVMKAGFLIVLGVQVLLYGLWSGIVQMQKVEGEKKSGRRK